MIIFAIGKWSIEFTILFTLCIFECVHNVIKSCKDSVKKTYLKVLCIRYAPDMY